MKLLSKSLYIAPLIACALLLFFLNRPVKVDVSNERFDFISFTSADFDFDDNSTILENRCDSSGVLFRYQVGTTESPDVRIGLIVKDSSDCQNLRGMDKLILTIDPQKSSSCNVSIHYWIPQFTVPNLLQTHKVFMAELLVKPNQSSYEIPLTAFSTPDWWYTLNRTPHVSFAKLDRKFCSGISFSNGEFTAVGEPISLMIRSISFHRNMKIPIASSGIFLGLFYCIVLLKFRRKNHPAIISYEPNNAQQSRNQDRIVLEGFLGKMYRSPDLTLEKITDHTAIPAARLRSILKEFHGKTVKEYITEIRITEAKRLLCESDKPIAEIARDIGFVHVSSFTHVFKKNCGVAPGLFRKEIVNN